jgi:hypothetical protein
MFLRRAAALVVLLSAFACAQNAASTPAPNTPADDEIPIERCDVLPVVPVTVAGQKMRFLVDTGATSILNLKAFSSGAAKSIRIDSWRGSAATSAREVTIPEFRLGNHVLRDLKLPAIDLSPIGKACSGEVDGLLGVDLLDRMGVTIDLERKVAVLHLTPSDWKTKFDEMEGAMHHCTVAFNEGRAKELEDCFDESIVLYTSDGEFRGREQVMRYFANAYFKDAPRAQFRMTPHEVRGFGDALWYSYDYTLDTPAAHHAGHGMAMCQRENGTWRMLNMHNSHYESGPAGDAGKSTGKAETNATTPTAPTPK